MSIETAPSFVPLERAEYAHQARLLLALHSARPVIIDGRQQFLHALRAQLTGGRVSMEAYLAGGATAVDIGQLTLAEPREKDAE